jgi:hypothetical protein
MSEEKVECMECGARILETTATRTGGICMPCQKRRTEKANPKPPVNVRCRLSAETGPEVVFLSTAQDLLQQLERMGHVGGPTHPNRLEVEAQCALLRHAMQHRAVFLLNDDHWGRTGYAALALFERSEATVTIDGADYSFSELTKEEWEEGMGPLSGHGGFLYRNNDGVVVYKRSTWRS